MASYLTALRAVASVYAKRIVRFAGFVALSFFVVALVLTWFLAAEFSSYWWLALIFILPMGFIGLVAFLLVWRLIAAVYQPSLTATQRRAVGSYVDKLQAVMETAQLSFWFILVMIGKDLLLHRDLCSLEQFIGDSTSLKRGLDDLRTKL